MLAIFYSNMNNRKLWRKNFSKFRAFLFLHETEWTYVSVTLRRKKCWSIFNFTQIKLFSNHYVQIKNINNQLLQSRKISEFRVFLSLRETGWTFVFVTSRIRKKFAWNWNSFEKCSFSLLEATEAYVYLTPCRTKRLEILKRFFFEDVGRWYLIWT